MAASSPPVAGLPPAAALVPVSVAASVAATASLVRPALPAVVLLVQAGFLLAWFRWAQVPATGPGASLALGAAALADLSVMRSASALPEALPALEPVAAVLGAAFVLALVVQILRRDGRPRVAASLTATVTATVLAVAGALWLAGAGLGVAGGPAASLTARATGAVPLVAVGVAAGALPASLALPGWLQGVLAAGGGALGALAAAALGPGQSGQLGLLGQTGQPGAQALAGLVGGLAGCAGVAATSYAGSARRRTPVAATLPVLLGGPVAYLLARLSAA